MTDNGDGEHAPPRTLRARIEAAAEESGLNLQELTVLDIESDPYRADVPSRHRQARWFASMMGKIRRHLRGVHYLTLGKLLPNGRLYTSTKVAWETLGLAASWARWLNYVPFDLIADERNGEAIRLALDEPARPGSAEVHISDYLVQAPALASCLPSILHWDPKPRQPYRIVFLGEKSSIRDELEDLAELVGAEPILLTGECSTTRVWEIATRAASDGRRLIILYATDFDPGGWTMSVAVARKIQAICDVVYPSLECEIHRVALTFEQVVQFNLPSVPLKATDLRADSWQAAWNRQQTELDALITLHPGALRQMFEKAVEPFWDATLDRRTTAATRRWLDDARRQLGDSEGYDKACGIITEAHAKLVDAIETFKQALEDARDELPDLEFEELEPPEPQIDAVAPEPLFTTDDDWTTATLKLIAQKRFIDGGGR
jgi:hypothetical protein